LKTLWTFENQDKLEIFCSILKEQGIGYEIKTSNKEKTINNGSILDIDEHYFEKAKKLLLKHRKRRTSIDKLYMYNYHSNETCRNKTDAFTVYPPLS
jgi:hypothetical protein